MAFGAIGTTIGGLVGGPAGAAIGGGLGSLASSIFGGGSSSSSSSSQSANAQVDPLALQAFATQAAVANAPLTAAMQGLGVLQGAYGGALGNLGDLYSSGQLSVLSEAGNRSKTATALQGTEVANLINAATDLQKQLGMARLGTELLSPQYLYTAGSNVLAGENELAKNLGQTNIGLRGLQEEARARVARDQATKMGDVFGTRATAQGNLALGAQSLNNALKLQQAKDLGSLSRIQAEGKRQLALKRFGANQALAGTRAFA